MNSIARIPNVIGIIMYLGHFSPQQLCRDKTEVNTDTDGFTVQMRVEKTARVRVSQ